MEKLWYSQHPLRFFLWPFSLLYQGIHWVRRLVLTRFFQKQFKTPILVVGNITLGGVGKTPLIMAFCEWFQSKGLRVGIVSRGYRASVKSYPHAVQLDDSPSLVGDEPLLLRQKTNCPVVIDPNRVKAVDYLLKHFPVDIILSDDGLQHYRMGRAIEIAVIDGTRGLGNGLCLPAGPLREPVSRLKQVDFILVNEGSFPKAYHLRLIPGPLYHLKTHETIRPEHLSLPIAALTGIGNPTRFFNTLTQLGLSFKPYIFPDHHAFKASDLKMDEPVLVMTEKDAIKCQDFAPDETYVLPVKAQLDEAFWDALMAHEQLKDYL